MLLLAAAAGAAAYALAKIGYDIIDAALSNDREYYQDTDARKAVACLMYQKIKGATPQFAEWSISLNDWAFGTVPEQDAIVSIVAVANTDVDLYMNFLLSLQDTNDITASLPACDCPVPLIFDQLQGPTGLELYGTRYTMPSSLVFSSPGDDQALCPGHYQVANDRYVQVTSSIGGMGVNLRVWLPENVLVTKIQVKWGISRPSVFGGGDKNAAIFIGDPTAGGVFVAGHSWPSGTYGYIDLTKTVSNPLGIVAVPHEAIYIHNSVQTGSGLVRVTWIHVECIPYVP
ncbi:hypothetical protein LCGC14_2826520 [marine sediment metagenome]|uniref:Uncharacterized protein n=1 Tax=marine sediment metagenome TaxID=412755 RepID=A0A0F9B6G9_9ZZZZ